MGVITRSRTLATRAITALEDHPSFALTALSRLLGWIYTLAWSASFYPQVIHNHIHKSTRGLSSDFVALNAVGHTSYFIYNSLLLFYEPVRRAYRKSHSGRDNVVQFNDWTFSAHATLLATITLLQYVSYKKPDQAVSKTVRLSLTLALTIGVFLIGAKRLNLVGWLHIVAACSTLKLIITLTKYLPQIKLNKDRRSTKGFSIENILLDLIGGVLSLLQLVVDAVWIQGSWGGVTGDWGKLGLSLLTIVFDAMLVWQHYGLYGAVDVYEPLDLDESTVPQQRDAGVREGGPSHASSSAHASGSVPRQDLEDSTESTALLR